MFRGLGQAAVRIANGERYGCGLKHPARGEQRSAPPARLERATCGLEVRYGVSDGMGNIPRMLPGRGISV